MPEVPEHSIMHLIEIETQVRKRGAAQQYQYWQPIQDPLGISDGEYWCSPRS